MPCFAEPASLSRKGMGGGDGLLYTYVPVQVASRRHGAIEIAESLSELADYRRTAVLRALVLICTMVLASGLILLVLGVRVVGRPLARLADKARRIGEGDFSADLMLHGRDELSAWQER
jgi:nitrogen fixation/metabolism regulation signal transduction histidine kinase